MNIIIQNESVNEVIQYKFRSIFCKVLGCENYYHTRRIRAEMSNRPFRCTTVGTDCTETTEEVPWMLVMKVIEMSGHCLLKRPSPSQSLTTSLYLYVQNGRRFLRTSELDG
jgi:hypothetical protein